MEPEIGPQRRHRICMITEASLRNKGSKFDFSEGETSMIRYEKRKAVSSFLAGAIFLLISYVLIGATGDSKALVIRNVRVFDGEKVMPLTTVVVSKGRIQAVGKSVPVPQEAEVVDGEGKTLLPGLIDSHVHIIGPENLKQPLIFGVTSVIDMFSPAGPITEIKKTQASEALPHLQAYVLSPMTLVTVERGHGTEYGVPIPTLESPARAQEFVDARIAEGSDFIKIIYDDGSAYNYPMPALSKEAVAAVIKAAHARGKMAIVHAGTLQKCIEVLKAGADGLAHLNFDDAFDPNFGKLAASKKAFVIPTLSVLESMNGKPDAAGLAEDEHLAPYLKPQDIQILKRTLAFTTGPGAYAAAEKVLRQLRQAGVSILAGTDSPNPGTAFGAALHGELELLVNAGLTPLEALRAATSVPAAKFKMAGRGQIEPNAIADLVLVEGDPTQDIKATRAIVAVWKDGARVNREDYLKEAQRAREAVEQQKEAPAPENLGAGLISDFEGDKVSTNFGVGWMVSTDSYMGGKSKAEIALIYDGAEGSKKSLLVKGTIAEAGTIRWAGALFSPGAAVMQPANLSSKKSLSFWAKGNGKSFAVMIFAQSFGFIPRVQAFEAGPEWTEYDFPFEKFGSDGHDIMGIFIGASNNSGEFMLQIDNVRLK